MGPVRGSPALSMIDVEFWLAELRCVLTIPPTKTA
jgi:hypothetical protein